MNKTIKDTLLITDLDGTLLKSDKTISTNNLNLIKSWMQNGGYFTVATGRGVDSVQNRLKDFSMNCPCILYNGCAIYDYHKRKFILVNYLEDYLRLIEYILKEYSQVGVEIFCEDRICVINNNDITRRHLNMENLKYKEIKKDEIPKHGVIKVLMGMEKNEIRNVKEVVDKKLPESIHSVMSDLCYLELLPKGVDKGYALKKLIDMYNINRTVAFGDYYNDLGMIKTADIGFVMDNAPKDVKIYADYIAKSNDDDGIYYAMKKIYNFKVEEMHK